MRRLLVASLLTVVACTKSPALGTTLKPKPERRAPIVVALVIDQQSAWAAAERWPELPSSGGIARLRREGTWVRNARYAHAALDTAPGHAAIHTGFPPRETGIVANERIEGGKAAPILRDVTTKLVDVDGATGVVGSSIAPLRVDTIADRFRKTNPAADIVSVSLKDRAAIMGGGRAPTATIWFEASLDRFVSSTAFGTRLPTWARPHATTPAIELLRARPWELLDPPFVRAHAATADDAPGEGDFEGLGVTFPHFVAKATRPAVALRATPYADEAVLSVATAAIVDHTARTPAQPMLLSLSLSANDYVGHIFGPDSFEAWDNLTRLDASLAKLFATLDAAVSADGWSVVLTGDHGSVSMPEVQKRPWCAPGAKDPWERPCGDGHRLDPLALRDSLDAAAVALLGPGRWIDGIPDPYVVYTEAARALPPEKRDKLDATIVERLRATPGVHSVYVVRTMPPTCASDDSVGALVCRSVRPEAPFDVYVVTQPGSYFDTRYVPGKGASHGSPWLFDRTVPIVVRAPQRVAPAVVREEPIASATSTRALAALLGLPADPRWEGVDLVSR